MLQRLRFPAAGPRFLSLLVWLLPLAALAQAPTITSFTPTSGAPATSIVDLTGAGFTGATAVTLNGLSCPRFVVNSATSLTVLVPYNAVTGAWAVTTAGGTGISASSFTVSTSVRPIKSWTPVPHSLTADSAVTMAIAFRDNSTPDNGSISNVRVYGSQRGGLKAVTRWVTSNGLTATPTTGFAAGEQVSFVVPSTVTQNIVSAGKQVCRFTVKPAGGTGVFGTDVAVGSAGNPRCVTIADINGDNYLDLVTGSATAASLLVQRRTGHLTYTATTAAVSGVPTAVLAADLDADFDLDLLSVSEAGNSLSVLRNSSGSFGTATNVTISAPIAAQVGDLDADGDLDVVVLGSAGTATVLLNDGTGVFTAAGTVSVGATPRALALADVDTDGDLDLLVSRDLSPAAGTVTTYRNNGSGAFTALTTAAVTVGVNPTGLVVADVDADGDLDLLTANYASNTVSLRLNSGFGTFAGTTDLSVGTGPTEVAVADVDADGDFDLLASCATGSGVSEYLNTAGTFGSPSWLPLAEAPYRLVTADMDRDWDVDVLVGTSTGASIWPNGNVPSFLSASPSRNARGAARSADVTATFTETLSSTTLAEMRVFGMQAGGLKAGTITQSSRMLRVNPTTDFKAGEVVRVTLPKTLRAAASNTPLTTAIVYEFRAAAGGTGYLSTATSTITATAPRAVTAGDLDNDGDLDLVAVSSTSTSRVNVRLNDGAGTFSGSTGFNVSSFAQGVVLADVDNDADLDLLIVYSVAGTISVHKNNGSGSFTAYLPTYYLMGGGAAALAVGDVNADGFLDIVTANGTANTASVTLNNGDGTFGTATAYTVGAAPAGVAVGDIDADGDLDLAVTNSGAATVSLLLGDGTGAFSVSATTVAVGTTPTGITLADSDGDGDPDLLVANAGANTLSLRSNNGAGSFSSTTDVAVGAGPRAVEMADLDGDGVLDFVTANVIDNTLTYGINNNNNTFATRTVATGTAPRGLALADLDGDLDLDAVVGNQTSGTVTVHLNRYPTPLITSFSPTSGAVGTTVTITGDYLLDATAVTFNGVSATFTTSTLNSLTAMVPVGATTGPISVTNSNGTGTSATNFSILPNLTSLSPAYGIVGTTVVLTGSNFIGATSVKFNGTAAASFTVNSNTQLTALVPTGATTGTVTVTTPAGTSTEAVTFTVAISVVSSSPTRHAVSAALGTNVSVTLNQPLNPATATLPLYGALSGKKSGTVSVSGSTLTLNPTANLHAGEAYQFSVPATVKSTGGTGAWPMVRAFTAAATSGTATLVGTTTLSLLYTVDDARFADFDLDGDLDVMTNDIGGSGDYRYYRNDGRSQFTRVTNSDFNDRSEPAVGDFDGDGKPDLFFTGYYPYSNYPYQLTGNGDFTFDTHHINTLSGFGYGFRAPPVVGDIDADGDQDAVGVIGSSANAGGRVQVFKSNGTTLVATQAVATTLTLMTPVALADLDLDGDLDLLLHRAEGGLVCLNDGTGTFALPVTIYTIAASDGAYSELNDVDGDGDLDIVTGLSSYTVQVRFNDGTGAFALASTVTTTNNGPVRLGDMDADGDLDLVRFGTTSGGVSTVNIRFNDGTGFFSGTYAYAQAGFDLGGHLGDFDGDGDVDVLGFADGRVVLRRNASPPTIAAFAPASGVVGDVFTLTGNHLLYTTSVLVNGVSAAFTLVSATELSVTVPAGATDGLVTVVSEDGTVISTAVFAIRPPVLTLSPARNARAAARSTDVSLTYTTTSNISAASATSASLRVFSAQRGGLEAGTYSTSGTSVTFNPTIDFRAGEQVWVSATTGMQTANGAAVLPQVYQFTAAASGGVGSFNGGANPGVTTRSRAVQPADLDGDGDLDLLVAAYGTTTTPGAQVRVLLGNGSGGFSTLTNLTTGSRPTAIAVGDIDADGDLDFVTANQNASTIGCYFNNGSATFTAGTAVGTSYAPLDVVLADLDADGDLDLASSQDGGLVDYVMVRLNSGAGVFGTATHYAVGHGPGRLVAADADGDGDVDLFTANADDDNVTLLPNDGTGAFGPETSVGVGDQPVALALADVDGDYDLDLLTANNAADNVSVCLNDGTGAFGAATAVSVGDDPQDLRLGDIDGDGDLDVVTSSAGTDAVTYRLNNGGGTFSGAGSSSVGADPYGLALADFDGDDDLDVATVGWITASTVSVRLNQNPAPTITGFTPASGPIGTSVVITGAAFISVSGVTFNGVAASSYTVNSTTQLTATVAAGTTSGLISITSLTGTGTSATSFLVTPAIGSFTPTSGAAGTSVVITGTTFTGATGVTFGGVAATAFTVNSATQITATVPTAALTGVLTVTTPSGTGTSAGSFTVTPTITSFSPVSGPTGTLMTLTGSGFTGATSVKFNGVTATSYTVVSATSITATVPATATTGTLQVTTPAGSYTTAASFTVTPTFASFTPTSGPVGTLVTLTGSGFTGATAVKFNGITATFTFVSATSLTATVPATATTGTLSVTTAGGTVASAGTFTVTPAITSFAPTSGPVGTSVIITGTTFTGATSVRFNGISAAFTVNSATQITATVPATATTGVISVTTPGGTFSTTASFTVMPTITSFTPTSGGAGASVIITGATFTGATAVSFNGVSATFTVNSSTQITATVPAAATSGTISVTTPSGTGTSVANFTVTPVVASFSPTSGPTGTSVVLTGTALTGATAVSFNGAAATFTVNSATQITATVPATATTGVISVTTPGGTFSTAASFSVTPGAVTFSPTSGPAGTSVTISGTTFTGATSLKFNGVSATGVTVVNSTTITATVPTGSAPGTVAVTTPSGTGTSAATFTVTFPVTAVSPTRNARAATRTTDVALTFPEPAAPATTANARVFGNLRSGRRSGATSTSGNTWTFNPTLDLLPGEQVSVSVPATVTNAGGAPATPHVYQFTAAAGVAPGGFGVLSTLAVSGAIPQPTAVALADLDGDGDLDLATAALGLNQVLVQQNTGAAGFGTATPISTANAPADVIAADVDNDGDLDLLTANSIGANSVSVLLNAGTGTFTAATAVAVGTQPSQVVAADVNGDGWLDLLTANRSTGAPSVSVALNLGTGAGTFGAASTLTTAGNPYGLAVGDLDADGDLDLTVVDRQNAVVRLALNDGAGTFTFSGTTVAVGTSPYRVALADVNADGRLDLLTANNTAATLSVALATGAATFGTATAVVVPAAPYALAAADVDGDGDLDLVTAHNGLPGVVSVRLNDGAGAFSGSGSVAVGNGPFGLALGDLDGNLSLDLVTADRGAATVSVLLNTDPPTLTGFTPTSGPEGTLVTLTGTNLTNTGTVKFNGTSASSFTVVSATQVTATVPAGATTGLLSLTALGNTTTSTGTFTVTPTLTSFTPAFGPAGTSVVLTGTTLTGATSVRFNGVAAASFTVNSSTQITVVAPAGVTTGLISVTTAGGTVSTATSFGVPPTISSFTPAGAGAGTVFTFTGLNFTGATAVQFNGTAALSYTVGSDTQLTATLPLGTSSGTLSVTTPYGTGTSATAFTLLPSIYSFSPTSGPVGTRVYLTGDGFTGISGAAGVKFNGTNASTYTVTSANELNARVAIGTSTGPISLVTSAGTLTSATSFTITTGTPVMTNVSPLTGPVGTTFFVLGGPFLASGATAITGATVGGVTATFVRVSTTSIQVTVPAGASGTGDVTLSNASGSSTAGQTFTVLDIFDGPLNQCATSASITSTGANTWQWILAPNGKLVAAVKDGGRALGTVYAEYQQTSTATPRHDGRGTDYLDRNWHLVAQNGFTGYSVQVKFFGLNTELVRYIAGNDGDASDVTGVSGLRLTQYSGNNENCALADNATPTQVRLLTPTATEAISGTNWFSVTATVPDHFSEFYLNGGGLPLPVELTRFAAARKAGGGVSTTWATASERNSAGFVVERSADGLTFLPVSDLLPGAGTSPLPHTYAWTDYAAPAALTYYRLRQMDLDGTTSNSAVAAVAAASDTPPAPLTLWPNPATASVSIGGSMGAGELTLFDVLGRPVRQLAAGTAELSVADLPAGTYQLRAENGAGARLVVVH